MGEFISDDHCIYLVGFLGCSAGNESACDAGDPGLIPGLGSSPGEGNGNSLQYTCLENPCGQKSLAGYSPCGHRESDTTETNHSTAQPIRTSKMVFAI